MCPNCTLFVLPPLCDCGLLLQFSCCPVKTFGYFWFGDCLCLLLFVSFIFVPKLKCECYGGKFMDFKFKHMYIWLFYLSPGCSSASSGDFSVPCLKSGWRKEFKIFGIFIKKLNEIIYISVSNTHPRHTNFFFFL